jgi:hypothetical protein
MAACCCTRRSLRTAQIREVGAVVGDVLDLEGVEDQPLAGERGLGLVGDPLGEGRLGRE